LARFGGRDFRPAPTRSTG